MNERKISPHEWEAILKKMNFYNRSEGYVYLVDDKLIFFDSDPRLDAIGACHVTKEQVIQYSSLC